MEKYHPKTVSIFPDNDETVLGWVKLSPKQLLDRPETLSTSYYGVLKIIYLTEFSTGTNILLFHLNMKPRECLDASK